MRLKLRKVHTAASQLEFHHLICLLAEEDLKYSLNPDQLKALEIWILDDDQIPRATSLISDYLENPQSFEEKIKTGVSKIQQIKEQKDSYENSPIINVRTQRQRLGSQFPMTTFIFVLVSVLLYFFFEGRGGQLQRYFYISEDNMGYILGISFLLSLYVHIFE